MAWSDRDLTPDLTEMWLNPSPVSAEEQRPWQSAGAATAGNWDRPLLRLWDEFSGSQPDKNNRMHARSDEIVNTIALRHDSLRQHLDHRNRAPAPYISFQSDPAVVERLANTRRHRGTQGDGQMLTVINPNMRIQKRLPLLNLGDEIKYYYVENVYGRGVHCEGHYLCLWQVTSEEIVKHYPGFDTRDEDWYENIVMPEFLKHEEERKRRPAPPPKRSMADEGREEVLWRPRR